MYDLFVILILKYHLILVELLGCLNEASTSKATLQCSNGEFSMSHSQYITRVFIYTLVQLMNAVSL